MIVSVKDENHRNLIAINSKTGVVLEHVTYVDTEKGLVELLIDKNLFHNPQKLHDFLLLQYGRYQKIYESCGNGFFAELRLKCKNVRVIMRTEDPYDFIQCPDYMDFKFFKEKVIPAMKVARGLGKPIPIESFYKYCEYPKYNFALEKGY